MGFRGYPMFAVSEARACPSLPSGPVVALEEQRHECFVFGSLGQPQFTRVLSQVGQLPWAGLEDHGAGIVRWARVWRTYRRVRWSVLHIYIYIYIYIYMHLAALEPGFSACSARRKHAPPGLGLQGATIGAVAVTAQVRVLRHADCFWEQACSRARRSVFGPQLGVSLGPRCSQTTAHFSPLVRLQQMWA